MTAWDADWTDPTHPPVDAIRLGDDRVWVSWDSEFNRDDEPLLWHWCTRRGWGPDASPGWAAAGGSGHDLIQCDPLTLSPSVYWPDCCGMHGFITDGQWRDA